MKIAVISDTHFGDKACQLFNKKGKGVKYDAFKKALDQVTPLDYLVLAGDIIDFAISSYQEAFEIAQEFFKQLKRDNIAKEMIYLAGNHDFDIWHAVEYEVNVIQRLRSGGKIPNLFKMSQPGILDDRPKTENKLFLPGVTRKEGAVKYSGLFLDNITQELGETHFNFVYPNLYLVTDQGETVMITHGQYLEPVWSGFGEIVEKLEKKDLKIKDLKDMVSINFPLSQLTSSGIGQAGKLTKVAAKVEHEVKAQDTRRIKRYLDILDLEAAKYIDNKLKGIKEAAALLLERKVFASIKEVLLKSLGNVADSRFSKEFMEKEDVRARFIRFFDALCSEIDGINKSAYKIDKKKIKSIPYPARVIFGHTHQPIPWEGMAAPDIKPSQLKGNFLELYNTGGWLINKKKFVGAEVFIYETGKGFRSENIR
ncbi:MAG: hypothetical protein GY754_03280 [bacterium]|nr:hypothetical protein [bacterium]